MVRIALWLSQQEFLDIIREHAFFKEGGKTFRDWATMWESHRTMMCAHSPERADASQREHDEHGNVITVSRVEMILDIS